MAKEDLAKNLSSLGRNEKCHCGSGKKYKHCHWDKDQEKFYAQKQKEEARMKAEADAAAAKEAEEVEKSGAEKGANVPPKPVHADHPSQMKSQIRHTSQVRLPRKSGNS
ncbi:MAG: SEC-C metal-binding domain-containing protein [Spirochaetota bacterium]